MTGNRTARRRITKVIPEWSEQETTILEPSVRDYLVASKTTSDYDRAVELLAACVLDSKGKPVGKEAILEAPLAAYSALSAYLPELLGVGKGEDDAERPLDQKSTSDTA